MPPLAIPKTESNVTLCSVLIAARNEIFLQRTIEDVLAHARGDTEVISVTDGYQPDPPLALHPRLTIIHHETSIGQRAAINEAARASRARFIMKLDAHCAVDEAFDVKLAAVCEPDWTVLPQMRHLEAFRWVCSCGQTFPQGPRPICHEVRMDVVWRLREGRAKIVEAMFIDPQLRARYFDGPAKREFRWRDHYGKHLSGDVCDVMVGMGPGWFLHRDRYWELGGLDEDHGSWGQMGVEIALKAWLSGGRHVVNRRTWFAHLFRTQHGFGYPYPITNAEIEAARAHSREMWLHNKWPLARRPFQWVLDKFAPVPGWPAVQKTSEEPKTVEPDNLVRTYHIAFDRHLKAKHAGRYPIWHGIRIVKFPNDMIQYAELIFANKPDLIVETGTRFGGSALFFADLCEMNRHGNVISIDIRPADSFPRHPRITYLTGRSTSKEVLDRVAALVAGKTVMVSLDSDHRRVHVKRELHYYGRFVTPGQYLVVEDTDITLVSHDHREGPLQAVQWYLARHKEFAAEPFEKRWWLTHNPQGWLRRMG